MECDEIAIGELSRNTGCNIETVRYYERIGLLPKPNRRKRNQFTRHCCGDEHPWRALGSRREMGGNASGGGLGSDRDSRQ